LSAFKTVSKHIGRLFRSKNPRRVGKKGPGVMRLSADNDGQDNTSKGITEGSLPRKQVNKRLLEKGESPTSSAANISYQTASHLIPENGSPNSTNSTLNKRKFFNFYTLIVQV